MYFPTYLTVFLGLYILQLPSPVTCSMVPPLLPKIRKIILYSRPFILCANTAWLVKLLRGGCHIKCLLFVEFNVCVCTADFQTPKWTSVTSLWHPCVVLRAWEWVRLNWIQTSMWVADIKHNVSSGHDIHTDSNTATTFYILILRLKMIRPSLILMIGPSLMLTTNVTCNSFSISKYS